MKKYLAGLMAIMFLSGCSAYIAQRKFEKKLVNTVMTAYSDNDSCTSVCIKVKALIAERLKQK